MLNPPLHLNITLAQPAGYGTAYLPSTPSHPTSLRSDHVLRRSPRHERTCLRRTGLARTPSDRTATSSLQPTSSLPSTTSLAADNSTSRLSLPKTRQLPPRPFPLKWTIQTIDPLRLQRPTAKIQSTNGIRRFHHQATIQIPAPRLPTRPTSTIQTTDPSRPQRSTVNRHNLRYPSIASGVRLFEPAPLDWPKSQPNLLYLDIAHRAAVTYP